jgi:hypothetical protein
MIGDFVAVNGTTGIDPAPFKLESVKKNGPFTPILKGNVNFICIKSGLFEADQDSDAACAGVPAELDDPDGKLIPGNITRRLGLAPGQTQSVRIRQEFGDFRGALLKVLAGTLNATNVDPAYAASQGLARFFDCEDQRELEFCHPDKTGDVIGYLDGTDATWLTPESLEEIEWVIVNQPGDAPTIMNFQDNFGHILAMAGFIPSAEFYAPDPNPLLMGTPDQGVLIRQQVLGEYLDTEVAPSAPEIISDPVTTASEGTAFSYQVEALALPAASFALDSGPSGMVVDDESGLLTWAAPVAGTHPVTVRASNGTDPDDTQTFSVTVTATAPPVLDAFERRDGAIGSKWKQLTPVSYGIKGKKAIVGLGGPAYWMGGSFGADQEASVVMTGVHPSYGQQGLVLKVQGTSSKPTYTTGSIKVYYQRGRGIVVDTHWNTALPKEIKKFPITLVNGDRLSARALTDGTVKVFVNGSQLGTANAGSKFVGKGGRIGVWHIATTGATFDDFGGR